MLDVDQIRKRARSEGVSALAVMNAEKKAADARIACAGRELLEREKRIAAFKVRREERLKRERKERFETNLAYEAMKGRFRMAISDLDSFEAVVWCDPEQLFKLSEILRDACREYKVTAAGMRSGNRISRLGQARQYYSYRARRETDLSYPDIARFISKDHTSIIHAERRYMERMGLDQ